MTPLRLLSLWRQRWGKTDARVHQCSFEQDSISEWNRRVQESRVGQLPGMTWLALFCFILPTVLLTTVRFTLIEQAIFSAVMLGAALWIRRFQGKSVSIMMAGLTAISSARYLEWRFVETLDPSYSLEFFVRLALLMLEVYGAVFFVARMLQGLWPAWMEEVSLAEQHAPRLGVLVLATDCSQAQLERSMQGFMASQWPAERMHFYVLDASERADLRSALLEKAATYLTYTEALAGRAGLINRALVDTKEELIAIVNAGQSPHVGWLNAAAGWLQTNVGLGVVSTSRHFLLPEVTEVLPHEVPAQTKDDEFLLARRVALINTGGVPLEAVSMKQNLVQRLSQNGWNHVCVLSHEQTIRGMISPYPGAAVRWRLTLKSIGQALAFYRPLLRLALLTLPLLYLLAGILPVQAPVAVLLSYLVPHLLQAFLLQNRITASCRLPFWVELRELLLAAYVLLLTTFFVLWTQVREWKKAAPSSVTRRRQGLFFGKDAAWQVLALLHALAWIMSALAAFQVQGEQARTLVFYMGWSVVVMLLLAARLAVSREMQEIAHHTHTLRIMPAMIRLINHRTLSCQTVNFPAPLLRLTLPAGVRVACGQDVQLSIFHAANEFVFDAQVRVSEDGVTEVHIDPANQPQYAVFARAALARTPNWPAWLPSEHVDRLFPNGMVGLIERLGRGLAILWHSIRKRSLKLATAEVNAKWKKKV